MTMIVGLGVGAALGWQINMGSLFGPSLSMVQGGSLLANLRVRLVLECGILLFMFLNFKFISSVGELLEASFLCFWECM